MKCAELLAALNDYVDGEEGTALCRELESHLAGCNSCQVVVDNIRKTITLYRAAEIGPPDELHDQLCSALRQHWQVKYGQGQPPRNPPQRRVVLEELRNVTSHPTASELHAMAQHRLSTISLRSVRRNLTVLVQLGMVQKLETSGFEPRFDGNTSLHDHLRCRHCGRVADLDRVQPDLPRWSRQGLDRLETPEHGVELIGTCPGCTGGISAEVC